MEAQRRMKWKRIGNFYHTWELQVLSELTTYYKVLKRTFAGGIKAFFLNLSYGNCYSLFLTIQTLDMALILQEGNFAAEFSENMQSIEKWRIGSKKWNTMLDLIFRYGVRTEELRRVFGVDNVVEIILRLKRRAK